MGLSEDNSDESVRMGELTTELKRMIEECKVARKQEQVYNFKVSEQSEAAGLPLRSLCRPFLPE